MKKFFNPMIDRSAADPFMTYDWETEYYYALFPSKGCFVLYRSKHAGDILRRDEKKVIYSFERENKIFGHVWAPEMHKAPNGKWYIYSSSSYRPEDEFIAWGGEKRLFILESDTTDPFDGFHFKNRPDDDMYAIDPTAYTAKDGRQYICYSLCSDKQELEIRELVTPWEFSEKRAVLSSPEYAWEREPTDDGKWLINEGPFFVENEGHLYIVYSYNGCFNDNYGLGVLKYVGGDFCEKSSWKKCDEPFFTKGNGVYGPGHATFFRSPDKTELWIAYHGMDHSNPTQCGTARYMNIQKIEFEKNGELKKATPVGWNVELVPPSGEIE